MLIADFLPADGDDADGPARDHRPGRGRAPRGRLAGLDDGELKVSIKGENIVAGKEGRLTFTVTDRETGAPVTDLEPYLGAPAHMLIVRTRSE